MFLSLLVGIPLTLLTIACQASGTIWWVNHLRSRAPAPPQPNLKASYRAIWTLCSTGCFLLLVHVAQVALWALAYMFITRQRQFPDFESAYYFSAVTFCSLGYGDVVITGPWRSLSATQAMVGLFVFGWSAALIFAIVQRILTEQTKIKSEA